MQRQLRKLKWVQMIKIIYSSGMNDKHDVDQQAQF